MNEGAIAGAGARLPALSTVPAHTEVVAGRERESTDTESPQAGRSVPGTVLLYLLQETAALTEKASDQTQSEIQRQVSRRKLRLMEIAGRDLAELQRTLENAKLQVDGKTRTLSDLLPLY